MCHRCPADCTPRVQLTRSSSWFSCQTKANGKHRSKNTTHKYAASIAAWIVASIVENMVCKHVSIHLKTEAKTLHAKLPHRSLRGSLHRSPKTPTLQTCEHSMTAAVMQVETNLIAPYRHHFQFGCDCQPYLQTTQTHVSNQSVLPSCLFMSRQKVPQVSHQRFWRCQT